MSAGIITAIVLSVVGIAKLPFNKFKEKHPKWYRAVFTLLSIVLTFGACLVNQLFVLEAKFDFSFAIMLITAYAGVFGLYHSYEGLGLKTLVQNLVNGIKTIKKNAPESKLSKYIDKVGVEVALNIINAKQNEINKVENAVVENQIINAEHVEINNANVQNSTINTQN